MPSTSSGSSLIPSGCGPEALQRDERRARRLPSPRSTVRSFDIDDTLCAYRRPGEELLAGAFASEGVEPFFGIGEYYDRFEEFATDRDATREVRAACFAAIADERGYDRAVGRALAKRYEAARDHRDVAFLPGARDAIGALGLSEAFETVIYAGRDVAPKPDRAPFDRARTTTSYFRNERRTRRAPNPPLDKY